MITFEGKRLLLLVRLLMAAGRMVTTEELIDVLYAEEPDRPKPRENVQDHVKHLKNQLDAAEPGFAERFSKRGPGYRLNVDADDVDMRRFEARARRMDVLTCQDRVRNSLEIALLGREALQEWGGVDVRPADCRPLADVSGVWAEGEKESLRKEFRKVLTAYWEAEVLSGNGAHLVPELREHSNAQPCDEHRIRLLMRAYCQAGNPAKAIDVYETLTRNLKKRYQREPGRETKELFEQIRNQESATAAEGAAMPHDEPDEPKGQTNNYGATFNQPFSITGSANVQGLVFGGENVSLNFGDQGALVPVPRSEAVPDGWQGGADVDVGDRTYLLHTPYLDERHSPDQAVVYREARALRREPERTGRRPEYVWLRQVSMRADTPEAHDAVKALSDEHGLLTELDRTPGLPRPAGEPRRAPDGRTTLAVTWPSTPADGAPCPGIDTMIDPGGGPLDPFQVYGLLQGLAGLCDVLVRLHRLGVAHRELTPAAVLAVDRGRLALRDLGLAARPFRNGEGGSDHQAPEQRTGAGRPAGPHTDVYRLAAVAYHLMTGSPPDSRAPLPVAGQVLPDLPERFGCTLDAALAADPAERPGMAALGAAFQNARKSMR
ncbi:BTAD domain-containing putative transcriptional regulator [Actinomadura geliboluensis]|uniref:BTAD domain-containing putative transcriptional regulator n=1 Tax=Actinomadura geliboluensis TaxID=882440 RepID=UPI0037147B81